MKTDAWMPFYPGDYLRDTMHLNTEEHGAYLLLLFCFWLGNGKMEDNDHQFANVTRLSLDRWQKDFRPILSKFFIVEDGFWTHKRVHYEKLKANNNSKVRSESGKLGGRPRKANEKQTESKPKANVNQNETPSPSPSPSEEIEREGANTPSWDEFRNYCQIHGGPAEWYAMDKWEAGNQDNWDKKSNWKAYANRCRKWWENDGRPMKPPVKKNSNGNPTRPNNQSGNL